MCRIYSGNADPVLKKELNSFDLWGGVILRIIWTFSWALRDESQLLILRRTNGQDSVKGSKTSLSLLGIITKLNSVLRLE